MSEARVHQDLARIVTGVSSELGDDLLGLWLVGPFAVGEGGIRDHESEPLAYPGYELLAVLRKRADRHVAALRSLSGAWSRLLATRVTLSGIRAHDLARVPRTRFWLELSQGGLETLSGTPELRAELPRIDPRAVNPEEPARLLAEALSAMALGQLEALPPEVCAERLHRLALAIGDAWLLRKGRYPLTRAERCHELERALPARELLPPYRAAIEYLRAPDAFRPEQPLPDFVEIELRHIAQGYLALEAERLSTPRHVFGYLRHPAPFTVARPQPALLSMARSLALRVPRASRFALSAQERLLRTAVALALAKDAPACRAQAAAWLRLPNAAGPAADAELARGLRELAGKTLADPLGHPFGGLDFLADV